MTEGDAEKMRLAAEVYDECKDITGEEKCETATQIGLCLKEHGEKKKIWFGM